MYGWLSLNNYHKEAKKEDTLITRGFQIYYNFIKPHMGLNGKTPAQKARIEVTTERNKWLALIKKCSNRTNN